MKNISVIELFDINFSGILFLFETWLKLYVVYLESTIFNIEVKFIIFQMQFTFKT